jgi:hypothetical protein
MGKKIPDIQIKDGLANYILRVDWQESMLTPTQFMMATMMMIASTQVFKMWRIWVKLWLRYASLPLKMKLGPPTAMQICNHKAQCKLSDVHTYILQFM